MKNLNTQKATTLGMITSLLAITFSCNPSDAAIVAGMTNSFQGGTTEGWGHGAAASTPPTVISNGGLNGVGDHALEISSSGFGGPGSRFLAFNTGSDWTGDYVTAGVTSIKLDVNNIGVSDLSLRLAFDGPGGDFVTNSMLVSTGSGWQSLQFAVQPADLISVGGGSSSSLTLGAVSRFQILSAIGIPGVGAGGTGLPRGDRIAALARFDNITAVPEPNALIFISLIVLAIAWRHQQRQATPRLVGEGT